MNSKSIYRFEISGVQRMLESMSPVLQSIQMSNAMAASIPTSMITQQLFDATQPLREAAERWNQMFNSARMVSFRESTYRISEMMRSPAMVEANNNLQRVLKSTSLQMKLSTTVQQLNLSIDPQVIETFRRLAVDTFLIEKSIQNNLRIFSGLDWSELINPEDLNELDFESALDGAVIDVNGGITFQ